MKKAFKIGCFGLIGLFVLIAIVSMISFSGEEESVSTGSSTQETSKEPEATKEEEASPGTKTIDVSSQTQTLNGLVINLGEMKISKDKIQVGMNINNTSDKTITFYPDQGNAVIGSLQVDANLFFTEGDISGDIMAGVQKDGIIEFLAPEGKEIDVEAVKEIKLHFGSVNDETYRNTKEANFIITVQ